MTQEEYEALLARAVNNFADRDYFTLMDEALDRVDARFDKRPGSMVWNGNAPCLAEVAQAYQGLDFISNNSFILTSSREYLIRRAVDRSIKPYPATPATYSVILSVATGAPVPAGTRFSAEELNFVVIAWPEDGELLRGVDVTDEETGESGTVLMQLIRCETAGTVGNASEGLQLIPIEYVPGLAPATVGKLVTAGEDEEPTEDFRARVIEAMRSISFGGNKADYREKVLALDGIEQCKVYPVWNGDLKPADLQPDETTLNAAKSAVSALSDGTAKTYLTKIINAAEGKKLTVGGTVRVVVMSSNVDDRTVSEAGVAEVQTMLDPADAAGEGDGLAPIGHVVKVDSVRPRAINITVGVSCAAGVDSETLKNVMRGVIEAAFRAQAAEWEKLDHITVYNSMLLTQIMTACASLLRDMNEPVLSGADRRGNLVLESDEIPVLGVLEMTDLEDEEDGDE